MQNIYLMTNPCYELLDPLHMSLVGVNGYRKATVWMRWDPSNKKTFDQIQSRFTDVKLKLVEGSMLPDCMIWSEEKTLIIVGEKSMLVDIITGISSAMVSTIPKPIYSDNFLYYMKVGTNTNNFISSSLLVEEE